jgi:hypothetical protein
LDFESPTFLVKGPAKKLALSLKDMVPVQPTYMVNYYGNTFLYWPRAVILA